MDSFSEKVANLRALSDPDNATDDYLVFDSLIIDIIRIHRSFDEAEKSNFRTNFYTNGRHEKWSGELLLKRSKRILSELREDLDKLSEK